MQVQSLQPLLVKGKTLKPNKLTKLQIAERTVINMARERIVSRTITSYEVECITMNIESTEVEIKVFTLTGDVDIKNNEKVLKAIKKIYETEDEPNIKIVAVRTITGHEELYGMSEVEFVKLAKRLDSTTRKPIEEEQ